MLKAIFPVLISDKDSRGFLDFPFQHFNKLSTLPSIKTKQKLVAICVANGIPLSEKAVRRSVKEVVAEITQNQGVKMSELGAENIAMSACEKRIFDKVNYPLFISTELNTTLQLTNTIKIVTNTIIINSS